MSNRPVVIVFTVALLLLIGLSGFAVGAQILTLAGAGGPGSAADDQLGGLTVVALGASIAAYGLACVAAAVGLWRGRPWGLWLGWLTIAVGIAVLAWTIALGSRDAVTLSGLGLWLFVGVLLVSPPVRSSLRR